MFFAHHPPNIHSHSHSVFATRKGICSEFVVQRRLRVMVVLTARVLNPVYVHQVVADDPGEILLTLSNNVNQPITVEVGANDADLLMEVVTGTTFSIISQK